MTHPYQDLKEAAEKVIEVRSTYIMSQSSDVSRDWGEALAEFRRIGNVARILSLIADYERMREALTPFAEFNTKIDAHPDAAKTPDDYCIHDGLKVGDFRRAFSVIKDKP